MKNVKKIIIFVILAAVLVFLLNPEWNFLLSDSGKQALKSQLNDTFGALSGGTGMLTPARIISAIAVIIIMLIICMFVCSILKFLTARGKKKHSVYSLFISLVRFLTVIIAIVWALGILGINLTAIFASLGIASLIIGFGAQSLIEDSITGIFIIFEGQYNVGDIIVLDEFRGVVRHIGIRTTTIEDDGGNMKIVNNSDIRNVQNRSKSNSLAVCDFGISYSADIESVEKVLIEALPEIYENHKNIFVKIPRYMGVQELDSSSVVMRVVGDVPEEKFFMARRILNREIKLLLDKNNIEIPFNQLVIHQADK